MRLFLASLIFISSSAFACPDLAGTYNCFGGGPAGDSDDYQKTITQKFENNTTVYLIKTIDLLARDPESTASLETLITNGSLQSKTERKKQITESSFCQKKAVQNIQTTFEKGKKVEEFSFKLYKKNSDLIIEAIDMLDPEISKSIRTVCRPVK